MRKTLVAAATLAVLAAGALLASRADAMTLAAPAGARAAIDQTNSVEKARYVCYRTWRRGGWRRVCRWDRPYVRYRSPYYYGYPHYAYRPHYYGRHAYAPWRRPGIGFYFRF